MFLIAYLINIVAYIFAGIIIGSILIVVAVFVVAMIMVLSGADVMLEKIKRRRIDDKEEQREADEE